MKSHCFRVPRHGRILSVSLGLALVASRLAASSAFPGAEGQGALATGGRDGDVYHVTTLADTGTGSFRDAVGTANRTVVFDVGGVITLNSPVVVKSNITIAGQTAPGEGITLYGDRMSYSGANNVVTRYIRLREGINGDAGTDGLGAETGDLMMFDHMSTSWGRDETFSLNGSPSHVTLQDCIIGQGLLIHSAGSLMQTPGGVSIFRCLYTDNYMRNPKVKGVNDYINNVVYNWGSGGGYIPGGDSAGITYATIIGSYFIAGPTTGSEGPFKTGNQNFNLYHRGNYQDLDRNGTLDGVPVTDASFPTLKLVTTTWDHPMPAKILTAQQAYAYVVANAGASLHRDQPDSYMINELVSVGTKGAHISNESEVGGVGTVAGGVAAKDTDGDGMPDWWEEAAGTKPAVDDHKDGVNSDGYTNLERYLNAIAASGLQTAWISSLASDTGSSATDGVTSVNKLVLRGTATPNASVAIFRVDQKDRIGTTTANASGNWVFDYSATSLPDRYYAFQAAVVGEGGVLENPSRAFVVKVDSTAAGAPTITSIVASPAIQLNGTSEPGSTIVVTLVGVGQVGTAVTDALGNWTAAYSGAALPAGSYTFTATAVDLAGNNGPASAAYAVNTGLAAPVFTTIADDTGASATDWLTNDTKLVFNGTSFANATVTITRVGVGVIGSTTANASGVWTFDYTATALAAGTHVFFATATDGGAASPASLLMTVTVDTVKPTITSSRRSIPATAATTPTQLTYRVTFSEGVRNVDLTDFKLTASGAAGTLSSCTAVSTSVYDVTVTGVSGDGTLRLDLNSSGTGIVDYAGNAISGAYTGGQTYTIRLPGSGVWLSSDDGDAWSDATKWQDGIIPDTAGTTADFSQVNASGAVAVKLDTPRTVGRVVFGDIDWTTPGQWTLTDGGVASNILTLSGTTAYLQVDAATTTGDTVDVPAAAATPSNLGVVLAGTNGFTKTGVGTLQILKPATITGPLTITKGIVQVGPGGSLTTTTVTISTSQQLRVAGGSFVATGDVSWTSGTGTGIQVTDGTASFQRIIPSNARNSSVTVKGGSMTATELNFPRSGDSEVQAIASGVLISGGTTTITNVGLGTADSWGAMTVSGGQMNVTGALNVGWQKSSARGGVVTVSGGELNVTDSTAGSGLILAHNPGGSNANTNNVAKLILTGGVTNAARMTLGYDSTSSAGSATVSLTGATVAGAELNLGSGGIVKNGTSGLISTITLNSGTLGALASWSTSHPLVVAGTPNTLVIRAADRTGVAANITLAGALTGTGGFAKTGLGTLILSGANTYSGDTAVNGGTLRVSGSLASPVTVNAGSLEGSGTLAAAVTIGTVTGTGAGASVAPGDGAIGTLTTTGALMLNADATYVAENNSTAGTFDKIVAAGVTLAQPTLVLQELGSNTPLTTGTSVMIIDNTDSAAVSGTFANLAEGGTLGCGINSYRISYVGGTGNDVVLTVIAEPALSSAATVNGTIKSALSYTLTFSGAPTSLTATGLPPGLSLNAATGVISGTPTVSGMFQATVTATNAVGTGSAKVNFVIAALTPVITSSTSASVVFGQSFTYAITASNVPTQFAADGLPAGLAINASTGVISGTSLVAGTFPVELRASNSAGTGTATLSLTVALHPATLRLSNLRQKYDGSPKTVTAVTDPSGLSVAVTYDGSSTPPTAVGSYAVSAMIVQMGYAPAVVSDTLVIAAGPTITSSTKAAGTFGQAFNYQITGTPTPTSYDAIGLPSGLSVDPATGKIAGTPTVVGTFPVQLSVTDANGTTVATLTLTIAAQSATVTLSNLNQSYTGSTLAVTTTTQPANLKVSVTYDGAPALPVAIGSYAVVATVNQTGYTGSAAGTLVVTGSQWSGYYFGPLSDGGRWALKVNGDGTGVFLSYSLAGHKAVWGDVTVAADGTFSGSAAQLASTDNPSVLGTGAHEPDVETQADIVPSGKIATDGSVTGTVTGLAATLSGAADRTPGTAASGYYYLNSGSVSGGVMAIVAPSGQSTVVAISPTTVDGATGSLSGDGTLTTTTLNGGSVSLSCVSTGQASATFTAANSTTAVIYSGALVAASTSRLSNCSMRGPVGTGDATLILGFNLNGGAKAVLIRGVGPTLTSFGLSTPVADPQLTVYDASAAAVDQNDNWSGTATLAQLFKQVGAFDLPATSKDAAVGRTLPAGGYTVHVTAPTGGVALAEVYDADASSAASLGNVSVRGQALTGEQLLVAGFVISGTSPAKLLIRGVGPTLQRYNVSGLLADPVLTVLNNTGAVLATNDNWAGTSDLKSAFTQAGAASLLSDTSADSALIITLQPGAYTVQLKGVNGTTGIAMIELFQLK